MEWSLSTPKFMSGLALVALLVPVPLASADIIYGTDNPSENIVGTEESDEIYGRGGGDWILGLGGDDILDGGDGSDFLEGGPGHDTLIGGPDIDYYYIHDDEDTIIEEPGVSSGTYLFVDFSTLDFIRTDLASFTLDTTKYPNVEGLTFMGVGPATLYGNEQNNYMDVGGMDVKAGVMIDAREGDDTVAGSPFDDTLYGGPGHDSIQPNAGNDTVYAGDGPDEVTVGEPWSNTPCPAASNRAYGEGDADTFYIIGVGSYVEGNEGEDRFFSHCGNSTLVGGTGNDTYFIYKSDDVIIEQPGEGEWDSISVTGEIEFTVPANIEQVWGDGWSQWINGSAGDDTLVGGGGGDKLNGSSGNDMASYTGAPEGVVADLSNPTANTGDAGGDSYASIENLQGSEAGDSLTGDNGANAIEGGSGDDVLNGDPEVAPSLRLAGGSLYSAATQSDLLTGGRGNDVIRGGPGDDTAAYSGGLSDYTVRFSAATGSFTISDKVLILGISRDGTDTVSSVEYFQFADGLRTAEELSSIKGDGSANRLLGTTYADSIYGFEGNDTLSGLAGNDLLDGGTGADIMSGGDGDDSYIVDNAGDKVKENARPASGTDTVYTALPAYVMPANVENLVYTGAASFSGKGNKSGNRMTGGPAADRLDGQKGNDVLIGLGGDDSYVVDSLADLVTEEPGGGYDAVMSSVTITTLSQNVEALTLSKGNISGTGNALDNLIIGSTSQNVLSGGDGADTLIGGLGNDSFYGETNAAPGDDADTVSYVGAKKAIVFSLANTLAGQNTGGAGTDRIYDVSAIENLTGSSFNDTLTGSATGNVLSGTDGNDTLLGLTGADVLVGGKGLDLIDAGADADVDRVTYLAPTDSPPGATLRDQVSGFTPGTDLIDLSAIDANTAVDGDQAFAFNGTTPAANAVWYAVTGSDAVISGDVNGDAVPDFEVLVKGVQSLQGSDAVP